MKRSWRVVLMLALLSLVFVSCKPKEYVKDGYAYLEEGEYEKAVSAFEKSIEKEQEIGEANLGLGTAYYQQEEYEKALAAFKEALAGEATFRATTYNLMAVCERRLGNLQAAINYYNFGLQQEGVEVSLRQEMKKGLITAYEESGDLASALKFLQEYVGEFPEDGQAQKELDFLQTR